MKENKADLLVVVLDGLAAAIWTVRAVLSVVYKEYIGSAVFFVLNMLCAVIWIAAFVKYLCRYRSKVREKDR